MPGLEVVGQATAGLGNDLNTAFNEPLFLPVGFKGIEGYIPKRLAHALDRFDNVVEMRSRGALGP